MKFYLGWFYEVLFLIISELQFDFPIYQTAACATVCSPSRRLTVQRQVYSISRELWHTKADIRGHAWYFLP